MRTGEDGRGRARTGGDGRGRAGRAREVEGGRGRARTGEDGQGGRRGAKTSEVCEETGKERAVTGEEAGNPKEWEEGKKGAGLGEKDREHRVLQWVATDGAAIFSFFVSPDRFSGLCLGGVLESFASGGGFQKCSQKIARLGCSDHELQGAMQPISLRDAGSGVYIYINIYMPITSFDGPLLGFSKARSRGKDEKLRQKRGKDEKEDKTLKQWNAPTPSVGFFWSSGHFLL